MAKGIVSSDRESLLRVAYRIEGEMPDVEECPTEEGGETRPEYLRKYKHCSFRRHPNEDLHAIILDDQARAAFVDLRARGELSDSPYETEFDPSWDEEPRP